MKTSISEFQSIGASVTWNPAASSCSFTNSFIGNGCICPEPEVEMPTVNLHGMQPASLSSALALSRLNVYCIGLPYQTCELDELAVAGCCDALQHVHQFVTIDRVVGGLADAKSLNGGRSTRN